MMQINSELAALARKHNLELPEGFKRDVAELLTRKHLQAISLRQEMFGTPGIWRDQEMHTPAENEKLALEYIKSCNELQRLEQAESGGIIRKIKMALGRKCP